jgi:hypothetical protein
MRFVFYGAVRSWGVRLIKAPAAVKKIYKGVSCPEIVLLLVLCVSFNRFCLDFLPILRAVIIQV